MSVEYDQYLTDHFRPLAGTARVQRNARFALHQHGKHFPRSADAAILEIGPGFGAMLSLLRSERGYADVHAVDISPEVVQACNQIVPDSTELTADTTVFLESCRASYDLILMFHVLEHVPKHEVLALLRAARGSLKQGGKLLVEVPNIAHPLTGPYHRYHDFTHTTGFTDQSLGFILRTAGFENVTVYPCKVPRISVARAVQRVLQDSLEYFAAMLLKLYMPRQRVILSSVLGACASD
jgi:cyclopropane fatty-acyl-phospholipid synthase-like methyltransferase